MIVPMKKLHMIVQKKDIESALDELRDLGSVHVEHLDDLTGYQLEERREEVQMIEEVLDVLKENKEREDVVQKTHSDWREICVEVQELVGEIAGLNERKEKRAKQIADWEPWGDFDPRDIELLKEKGIYVHLFEQSSKGKLELPEDVTLQEVSKLGGITRYIAVTTKNEALPIDRIYPPPVGLSEMKSIQADKVRQIEEREQKIKDHACYIHFLEDTLVERKNVLTFEEVEKGMKEEEELAILKGFCPENSVERIEVKAQNEGWALAVEDPTEEDDVPTLLKNPAWVNLSKPALNVIEILPGYKEFDVSLVFLIFFTLFFAILIGDAAYGLIFAGLTVFAHVKLGKKVKDKTPFYLMYLLTTATCVWGILTGTYFGQEWLPASVNPIVPWLNDANNIQWLCFTIALAHLSIARLWAAKARLPSLTALSEVGWLLIVWGMYYLANMFVLNRPMPDYALTFFKIGIPLALIFMLPFKEYKKLGQEIIPFVLSVIGAGTDIISYIRLFAVGLATVAVADAANGMPAALPGGVGIGFMVFLHILNLVLAAMAILVHAIRLNVLEFSGHLSLEWVGFKYSPFQRNLKQA